MVSKLKKRSLDPNLLLFPHTRRFCLAATCNMPCATLVAAAVAVGARMMRVELNVICYQKPEIHEASLPCCLCCFLAGPVAPALRLLTEDASQATT